MSRYAVMDIESISLDKTRVHPLIGRFSRIHNCRRKLAIELWNEQSLVLEAVPCVDYKSLSESERYTFGYSRKRFHRLTYQPFMSSLKCMDVAGVVKQYLYDNGIRKVYYKGGNLERDLCYEIDFDCENLEVIGVPKAPSDLHHDPRAEVSFYHREMRRIEREN